MRVTMRAVCFLVGQFHALEVVPVLAAELLHRGVVVFLEMAGVVCPPVVEMAQFVVAEQRGGGVLASQLHDLAAVGAAVDQVTEEDEAVVLFQVELVEEVLEFLVAPVDVTNRNEAPLHAEIC